MRKPVSLRIVPLFILLATLAAARAGAGEIQGSWTARISKDPGKLYVSLRTDRHDQMGSTFDRSTFSGLSSGDLESKAVVPVEFKMRREAGTLSFNGSFQNGRGEGDFTFASDPEYVRKLRSMGVRFGSTRGDDHELMNLALFDVSTAFIRSMRNVGYDETLDKYVAFRIFRVDPEYVREMASLGFDHLSADKLTETRIHGATPDYIRSMRAAGDDLTLDQYIQSRIFQITPEYAQKIARAGYPDLDRDQLVQFRIQNVTPEFIEGLRAEGYSHLPAQKLVEMRIFNVTPSFIRRANQARGHRVPVDKLVEMRIFNLDPEDVKAGVD
jgi:hypothetical protein